MNEIGKQPKRGVRQAGVLAWMRLARIYHKISTVSARQFRGYDLSQAQFDVLAQIGASEGLTQQELATRLLVTKGNISQLLARMEQHGLIRRVQDGRCNGLHLTDAGRELARTVVPAHEALISELLAPLTDDEQRHLLALLRKLDHTLD